MRKAIWFILLCAAFLILSDVVYAQSPAGGKPRGGQQAGVRRDRDNNPPGPRGGAGTNWENPPGPKGGPGASPDRVPQEAVNEGGEKKADTNQDEETDQTEAQQLNEQQQLQQPQGGESINQKAIVDKEWEKQADANHDGIVDKFEIRQWRQRKGNNSDSNL